jgi:3-dehydroquinate dehydratase-1
MKAMASARKAGAKVIISHHDAKGTPSLKSLKATVAKARGLGADVVKVACVARTRAENARLLALLDGADDIVVVGLGAKGRTARLAAPLLGCPFTYAAPDEGAKTEAGQLTLTEARRFYEALGAMD